MQDHRSSIKDRTVQHWSAVPIGTQTTGFSSKNERFSKEYFDDQSRFRFDVYAPWLRSVAGFDNMGGKQLLEVGCGMGADLLEFAKNGAIVTGLDLTPRHLEMAKRRFEMHSATGTFIQGDAEHLPFADGSFDVAFSNGVLHHTPDTAGAVNEIHRILRPGGEATIILYHRNSLVYYVAILAVSGTKRFLGHTLRTGNPFSFKWSRVLSASTDGEDNPLTKVYSRREGLALMSKFEDVRTEVWHLNIGDAPLVGLLPRRLRGRLSRSVGWYLVLRGRKGNA